MNILTFIFKEEEKLQEKSGYPEREKHYEKHEELERQFRNCMNTFRSMKDRQIGSVNLYRKM